MGRLTRPHLRRELNFLFDCIGRAFTSKCTNIDTITQTIEHIGYSLIHGFKFNLSYILLNFIGDRIKVDRSKSIFIDFYILYLLISI